ncbi:MAG TPA: hypothetical protein PLQ49_08260 [Methanothrix sp.]|nr:hypothetical protein [Methanothrix sp.]HRW83198.1 hypothetical protein [Methanothrix sp.]
MDQKSGAIIIAVFLAGIMFFSSFSSFIFRGGEPAETTVQATWNPSDFGVSGRLINWDFESLGDALGMYPEDLVFAFWLNMTASDNLTEAAALTLPATVGLTLKDQLNLYPSPIDEISWGFFGNETAEFHWTRPAPLGAHGLAVLYNGYQVIPLGTSELFIVMGTPVLFGTETSVKKVVDVISGTAPTTEGFVLPYDESDTLQISVLGTGAASNPSLQSPLGGDYAESYLGISPNDGGFTLTAKYLTLGGRSESRVSDLAESFGLETRSEDDIVTVSGAVGAQNLTETLGAFVAP